MELLLFEEVAEAVRALALPTHGELCLRPRRWGLKAWFGGESPSREHYEAQVIAADLVGSAKLLALEVGFHAEHRELVDNELVIKRLVDHEDSWRPTLGKAAEAAPFLGRPEQWRRLSETWPDPDLSDPALAVEVAVRLTDYIGALEPILRQP